MGKKRCKLVRILGALYGHITLRKKESQNGSPRRAIWSSVRRGTIDLLVLPRLTQLSMELYFGATLQARAVCGS